MSDMIKVTLVKSLNGRLKNQKATCEALGLRKINSSNTFKDDAVVRGMIKVVSHLVKVEEA
jgi:large subunit ribosomal protein L30